MPHLLVVDDDALVCELVADSLLADIGALVDCAHNGRDAAALLNGRRYDLALIDGILPDMGGRELAEIAANGNTPALIFCGHPSNCEELDRFAFPYLKKPFHLSALASEAALIIQNTRENILRVQSAAAAARFHAETLKAKREQSRRLIAETLAAAATSRPTPPGWFNGGTSTPVDRR